MQQPTLLDLPEDILCRVCELCASSQPGAVAALDALALTCHATRAALESVDAWALAGCALGLPLPPGATQFSENSRRARVRAADRADRWLAANAGAAAEAPGVRIHVMHRGQGFGQQYPALLPPPLERELAPLGLVAVRLDAAASTSSPPFVVVPVDPAFDAKGELRQGRGVCALPNCFDPAAPGCAHCGKHGGSAARRVVEAVASAAARAPPTTRRILFVAASSTTADAYRRAAVCVARRAAMPVATPRRLCR